MPELQKERAALQETMTFLGAMASGIELAVGESANSISYLASNGANTVIAGNADRPTLVVCIGNELVADDAVGFEVFTQLSSMDLPANVRLRYMGVGGIDLLDQLQGDEKAMFVVDAVQFGVPPGTIHQLPWDEVPSNDNSAISAHGIGLREAIEVGKLLCPEKLPPRITLFGIEGRCFNRMREYMTPETAAAIPKVVQYIERQLRAIYEGTDHENEQP